MPGHVPLEGNQNATHVRNEPQVPQSQNSLKHTRALLETEACNAGAGATSLDLKRGYGWKQDATAMKYLYKSTDQAVKMTGLKTGSRKANKTHKHSPEVHVMLKAWAWSQDQC